MRSPPARGAWIEMIAAQAAKLKDQSPPARGAWIEIKYANGGIDGGNGRPPHGGRGLK